MNNINPLKIQLIIVGLAAIIFIPFIGSVHLFDWDEINFAESAREMIVTGDYMTVQINFLPFWEKPPVFIWMQVLSMKVFGINEFAARFPNAIAGILTLLTLFNIGRKLRNNQFGVVWVLAYAGSVLPFLYFKSGIIDPWFNLFIFLSIYYLMLYSFPENQKKINSIVLSAAFAGLAIMTKGPVGFLLVAITGGIYLLVIRFKIKVKFYEVLSYFLVLGLVGGFWFILQILNGNYDTVVEFLVYQVRLFQTKDAGHGGFLGYHFVVLLFGVFPTSILALKSFKTENLQDPLYRLMKKWMVILFWVVLILFSIVKTKILHYSSLAYFPISFLAANYVVNALSKKYVWSKWQTALTIFIAIIFALPAISLQFIDKYKNEIIAKNWIHDNFAIANLAADINWTGFEFLPGVIFIVVVILIFIYIKKEQVLQRAIMLWTTTLLFTLSLLLFIVPKIEGYSQLALIEFLESKAGKNVYVKNVHFKSYATFFYGKTQPTKNSDFYNDEWLLTGAIDKDVYFVTKIHRAPLMEKYSDVEKIGEKNGFVFYLRKAE
ncbi:MAG: glycosyl transferase [Draconibacterium sp.]|nr:glycosyl transferase [Draconibacterium sp.]